MRIIFNSINCGLNNNGGSFSICKSANILQSLGHEVFIIDSGRNKYTWTKLLVPHVIVKSKTDLPTADAVIATGYNTYQHTINLPNRCGRKFVWIRGWELWNASEKALIKVLSNEKLVKIVNSSCLRDKLKSYGLESYLIRPGYDFDEIYPLNLREKNNGKIILGGLFNRGAKRSGKRTNWIFEATRFLKKNYSTVELYMFGVDGHPKNELVDIYLHNPSMEEKNRLYNEIDIWLSTSELEGLHITPAEAMLTEATIVGTNAPMSGTQDYLVHNETGLMSDNNQGSFIDSIRELIHRPDFRKKLGETGRQKILSLESREGNMKKLIKLIESL